MSDALLIGILVVAGIAVVFVLLRRKPAASASRPARGTGSTATRESMLQIVIPASGACCDAARKIESQRLHKQNAPPLPLADCSMKARCHCRYQPVPDRRLGERRQSADKRGSIRYEENPRRKGRGQRAEDKLFNQD